MRIVAIRRYTVQLVSEANGAAEGVFVFDEDNDSDFLKTLKLVVLNQEIVGVASDYFDAMCEIRKQLEPDGWRLLCYGGSRNVYPSGMARDLGRGLKAYKTKIGRQANELVSIFDSGPDIEPSSVDEQKDHGQRWFRSIGL